MLFSTQKLSFICLATVIFMFTACESKKTQSQAEPQVEQSFFASNRGLASNYVIKNYPILQAVEANGGKLSEDTKDWMKKWMDLDLEDTSLYVFPELSGSTSINLKVKKIDKKAEDGFKAKGSFVTRNSSANPDTEIAYFNLAAILGHDRLIRPSVRYELGPVASKAFQNLINTTPIKGKNRLENKKRILDAIATGKPLLGCMKAKKPDSASDVNSMADTDDGSNGVPRQRHPILVSLQAQNPMPDRTQTVELRKNFTGNLLQLAHEYSILMTLDSIFQQWDRYSGGNIGIQKDDAGQAHFLFTDNGGAGLTKNPASVTTNLNRFSRYDRGVILKLKEVNEFLENPSKGFLGYTNAENFVVDLGLYSEMPAAEYVNRLKRNLKLLFDQVEKNEAKYGKTIYFD